MPLDRLGRPLRDLRISVTDRCNFRCTYCMPKEVFGSSYRFLPRAELLTFEEIERLARIFTAHGVEKVRLTGGEPLLRRDVEKLVAMLAEIPGLDLTMTTNGSLLPQKAGVLAAAGLDRITVSLDSLEDDVFRALNDVDFPVARVLAGIEAAAAAGLLRQGEHGRQAGRQRGQRPTDGTLLPRQRSHPPLHRVHGCRPYERLAPRRRRPRRGDLAAIQADLPARAPRASYRGEVARRWRYADGSGEIGVIASVTQPFCGDCTRARLSADGPLYTCLFATKGHDVRALLRQGAGDEEISAAIGALWGRRTDRYSELRTAATARLDKVEMSYIGG